jgi:hypothetical protein
MRLAAQVRRLALLLFIALAANLNATPPAQASMPPDAAFAEDGADHGLWLNLHTPHALPRERRSGPALRAPRKHSDDASVPAPAAIGALNAPAFDVSRPWHLPPAPAPGLAPVNWHGWYSRAPPLPRQS